MPTTLTKGISQLLSGLVAIAPQDSYIGVRLGVAEGLLSGITTVHDWSHNTVSPQHADAELQALKDIGIRARFSYGTVQGLAPDKMMDLADLARVQKQWIASDNMLSVGACLRTPGLPGARGSIPVELFRTEFDAVRKLGLQATIHCGPKNLIDLMGKNGLLGPDMLLVHPQGMTADELKMVGETKSPWSIAPVIEASYSAVRSGTTQYSELNDMGVQLGLSIDASASTNADFFNVMRALMLSDWRRTGAPLRLKPRRLIELATIEGAKLLGLADKTGSLTPENAPTLLWSAKRTSTWRRLVIRITPSCFKASHLTLILLWLMAAFLPAVANSPRSTLPRRYAKRRTLPAASRASETGLERAL